MEDIDNGTTDNTDKGTESGTDKGTETTSKSLDTGDSPNKSLDDGGESGKTLEEGEDPHKTLPTRDHEPKKLNESSHENKANDKAYEEPKEEVKAESAFNLEYFDKPEEAPPEVTEKASELINGDLNYFDNWITEAEDQKKQNKEQLDAYLKSNAESGNQLAYNAEDFTEGSNRIEGINPGTMTGLFTGTDMFNAIRNSANGLLHDISNQVNRTGTVRDRTMNRLNEALETVNSESRRVIGSSEAYDKLKRELEFAKQKAEDINTHGVTKNTGISIVSESRQISDQLRPTFDRLKSAYESGNPTEIENAKRAYERVANRVRQDYEGSDAARGNEILNTDIERMAEDYGYTPTEEEYEPEDSTSTPEPARTESVPETPTSSSTSSVTEDDLASVTRERQSAEEEMRNTLGGLLGRGVDSFIERLLREDYYDDMGSAEEIDNAIRGHLYGLNGNSYRALANWIDAKNRERRAHESLARGTSTRTETPRTEVAAETTESETPETETESEEESTTESETPETETSTDEPETTETPATESTETPAEETTTETETETSTSSDDVIAKADEAKAAYEEAKKREYEAIHREADETEIAQLAAEAERLRQEWEEAEAEAAALRPREEGDEDGTKEPRIGHGREDRELSKEETLPEWVGGDDPHTSSAGAYWAGAFGDENWSDKVPPKTVQGLIDYANDHHDNPFAMFGMTALMEAGGYDALKAGKDVQEIIASAKEVAANASNAIDYFKNGSVKDGIKSILSAGWSVLKIFGNTVSAAWNVCKSTFSFLRSVFAPISSAVSSFLNTVNGYNSVKAMIRDMYGIENTDEVIGEIFGDNSETNTKQSPVNVLNKTGFSVKGGTVTDESDYNKGMTKKENEIASDVCKKTMLYFPYLRKAVR